MKSLQHRSVNSPSPCEHCCHVKWQGHINQLYSSLVGLLLSRCRSRQLYHVRKIRLLLPIPPSVCTPSFLIIEGTNLAKDIRDAHDAHVVLEAVRQKVLPLIKRRLLASERDQLQSGHVYVWEEAQDDGGLLRWTDGRRWS